MKSRIIFRKLKNRGLLAVDDLAVGGIKRKKRIGKTKAEKNRLNQFRIELKYGKEKIHLPFGIFGIRRVNGKLVLGKVEQSVIAGKEATIKELNSKEKADLIRFLIKEFSKKGKKLTKEEVLQVLKKNGFIL